MDREGARERARLVFVFLSHVDRALFTCRSVVYLVYSMT